MIVFCVDRTFELVHVGKLEMDLAAKIDTQSWMIVGLGPKPLLT